MEGFYAGFLWGEKNEKKIEFIHISFMLVFSIVFFLPFILDSFLFLFSAMLTYVASMSPDFISIFYIKDCALLDWWSSEYDNYILLSYSFILVKNCSNFYYNFMFLFIYLVITKLNFTLVHRICFEEKMWFRHFL